MPTTAITTADRRGFVAGALTFGFGLGGLADGIVLHQVLQWHHIASARIADESRDGLASNVFWDGSSVVVLLVDVLLLHRSWERRDRATGNLAALGGLTLIGWGGFHVVDQLVFHEWLNLHDIREDVEHVALYNWGFFAIGLVLIALGWLVLRTRGRIHRP